MINIIDNAYWCVVYKNITILLVYFWILLETYVLYFLHAMVDIVTFFLFFFLLSLDCILNSINVFVSDRSIEDSQFSVTKYQQTVT